MQYTRVFIFESALHNKNNLIHTNVFTNTISLSFTRVLIKLAYVSYVILLLRLKVDNYE